MSMTLEKLHIKVVEAENNMRAELEKRYPVGCKIHAYLHSKQQVPSVMTVIGHDGQGYVRAYMDSGKAKFSRYFRDVYFTEIGFVQK